MVWPEAASRGCSRMHAAISGLAPDSGRKVGCRDGNGQPAGFIRISRVTKRRPGSRSPSRRTDQAIFGSVFMMVVWRGCEVGRWHTLPLRLASRRRGITALHVDAANRLWLATSQSGVARVDVPSAERLRFTIYKTSNGLGSDNVRCITEDRQGRLYFGTAKGVDRLDPTTGRVKQYTLADGLANSFVTTAFRDREGILWFGTANGVSRLVPRPDTPQAPPPILISGLRVAGAHHPVLELGEVSMSLPTLASDQKVGRWDVPM
jgi:ligand-binding sensor domain-containing protein